MRIDPRKFFELLFLLMLGMCLLFIYLRNIGGQRAVQLYGGYEQVMEAYNVALKEEYRFGTYGDAMLITDR